MTEEITSKACMKCGEVKLLEEFYKCKKGCKYGRRSVCKVCSKERIRKRREANPEKFRESNRKWREANPEKFRESSRKWREANPLKVAVHGVRRNLKNYHHLTNVPTALVEAMAINRLIKREIKNANQERS